MQIIAALLKGCRQQLVCALDVPDSLFGTQPFVSFYIKCACQSDSADCNEPALSYLSPKLVSTKVYIAFCKPSRASSICPCCNRALKSSTGLSVETPSTRVLADSPSLNSTSGLSSSSGSAAASCAPKSGAACKPDFKSDTVSNGQDVVKHLLLKEAHSIGALDYNSN